MYCLSIKPIPRSETYQFNFGTWDSRLSDDFQAWCQSYDVKFRATNVFGEARVVVGSCAADDAVTMNLAWGLCS